MMINFGVLDFCTGKVSRLTQALVRLMRTQSREDLLRLLQRCSPAALCCWACRVGLFVCLVFEAGRSLMDCLLLVFSLALLTRLVAFPFSLAYRHRPVCLNWRDMIDFLSRQRLQKGDSHKVQTVVDLTDNLKISSQHFRIGRGQHNNFKERNSRKSRLESVDPVIDLTRIHIQSLLSNTWAP